MLTNPDAYDATRRVITTDAIKQPPYSTLTPKQWRDLVELYCTENTNPFQGKITDGEQIDLNNSRLVFDEIVCFAHAWDPSDPLHPEMEEGFMETPHINDVERLWYVLFRPRPRT